MLVQTSPKLDPCVCALSLSQGLPQPGALFSLPQKAPIHSVCWVVSHRDHRVQLLHLRQQYLVKPLPPISITVFLPFHIVSEDKIVAESNSWVTSRASTRADRSCPTPFPAEPPVICRSRGCQTIAPLVMLLKNLTRSKDKGPNLLTTCDLMLNGMR